MSEKDINILIRLSKKLGESICDEGTYEERQTKFLTLKWKYKGKEFSHKFPGSPKSLNYEYAQMRKKLRASEMPPPSDFGTRSKDEELLREIWEHLGTDDEGETPYGGDVGK